MYLDRAGDNNGPVDVMAMAREERTEMADFLASLRLEQWDHPSLCRGWRIRDVAAHIVSYEEHGWADLIKRLAMARFRPVDLTRWRWPTTRRATRRSWWSSRGNT